MDSVRKTVVNRNCRIGQLDRPWGGSCTADLMSKSWSAEGHLSKKWDPLGRLAGSRGRAATPDPGVVSVSPTLGVGITFLKSQLCYLLHRESAWVCFRWFEKGLGSWGLSCPGPVRKKKRLHSVTNALIFYSGGGRDGVRLKLSLQRTISHPC